MIENTRLANIGVDGALPIPSPRPPSKGNPNPTEVLSPSQVRCFMDCQIRWWFKYGLKVPDARTGNTALGRAVHSSLCENFAEKVDTREDLPTPGVVALFREAWANELEQTEFRDEENPQELAARGEALVSKYMDDVAPTIDPAVVEVKVDGEIGAPKFAAGSIC